MEINKCYNENCLDTMGKMPDGFIDLTVTSPPYDNLRTYNGYSFDFEAVAKELFRVTKQGGVVVWVVGDATIKGSETGTSFKQALFFKEIGFNLHDTMIWEKQTFTATGALKTRYAQVFEYMFVFSKGAIKTFNPIKDRETKGVRKKHGTIRQANGTTRKQFSIGKIYTEKEAQRFNVWRLNTECSNTNRFHPAQFPESLANDHIISWSNEGDLVYDPFMGSGTTAKMAIINKRNWIGSEISEEYCKIIERRITQKATGQSEQRERISSPNVAKAGLSVGFIQAKLFSNIEETKDNLADPDCCMCEGRGFYKVLCVGEYDEQEITVQCACKRKQNLSRFDV